MAGKKYYVINIAQQANMKSCPIMRFYFSIGLHNQLMVLVDGMVLADFNHERYDVVLPIVWGDSGVSYENRSQSMQFGYLYDAIHYVGYISSVYGGSSFRILQTFPGEFATENIVYTPNHDGGKTNDENNQNSTHNTVLKFARPKTVLDIGRFYAKWGYKLSDSKSFDRPFNILQCIKPAASIHNIFANSVQAMHLKYLYSKITAIHPRLEADYEKHCDKQNGIKDCWINELEWFHRLK